jgi:hypothetical protein
VATNLAIGFSQNPDPKQAFKEAALEVKSRLNLPSVDLIFILFTSAYAQREALEPVERILQPIRVVGAMTPALILPDRIEHRGVAILGICSSDIIFGSSAIDQISLLNLREIGIKGARAAATDSGHATRQALFCFLNGINKNNSHLLGGLQEALGRAFTFVGGVGHHGKNSPSTLLHNYTFYKDALVSLIIGGSAQVVVSARHGWKPLGKPRIIDDAVGNMIKQIDHKPAVSIYEDYFRDELAGAERIDLGDIGLMYPLGISTEQPKEYILRHPVEIISDGSIICQADVPTGSRVHLMIGDKDTCRKAAHDAAVDVRDQLFGKIPKLILIFGSCARLKLFGRAAFQEINIIKEILGLTVPILGMYTYGEIGPLGSSRETRISQILNASIVVVAIV